MCYLWAEQLNSNCIISKKVEWQLDSQSNERVVSSILLLFFLVIGWKLNLTTDIFFVYKTDNTLAELLRKKKQWLLPCDFPYKNRPHRRANSLHRIMFLQDFIITSSIYKDHQIFRLLQRVSKFRGRGGSPTGKGQRCSSKILKRISEINLSVAQALLDRKRSQKLRIEL